MGIAIRYLFGIWCLVIGDLFNMYYYRRKANPWKWLIIIIILIIVGFFSYWFYANYFSKIDFSQPGDENDFIIGENEVLKENLLASLIYSQGIVEADIENRGYADVVKDIVLHPGDKIKTGTKSKAIIKLENDTIIRLGPDSELVLAKLVQNDFLFRQLSGRSYHLALNADNYRVESLGAEINGSSSVFEIITNNASNFLAVLAFDNNLQAGVYDSEGLVIASRVIAGEKVLLNLKEPKNSILKIENFKKENLAKEEWYKWNFDLDQGIISLEAEAPVEDNEPDFSVIDSSLKLSAEVKNNGVYLSWSAYNNDDFKGYRIIRSETDANLKYPETAAIRSSNDKNYKSYADTAVSPDKKYYYRVCVVKNNDKIACGNITNIEIPKEKDTVPPQIPDLSISISEAGLALSWQKNNESDFSHYVILRSITNTDPDYPADQLNKTGLNFYIDNTVNITSVGSYHYRVCVFDESGNFSCSDSKTVNDGNIQ